MAKTPVYEQNLISMVSSLIHLRTIGEELGKKPFVIPRMADVMKGSVGEFELLNAQFDRTEEALQVEARPYLEDWLSAVGMSVGGEVRFEGSNGRGVARMRGRLAGVRLYPRVLHGKRCVELLLEEAEFTPGSGSSFQAYEDFSQQALAPVLNGGSRAYRIKEKDAAGVERFVVKVTLPIKVDDIKAMGSSPYYFRVV